MLDAPPALSRSLEKEQVTRMLLELAFWSFFWSLFTTLSTTALVLGVLHALSTEKQKRLKTVEKPVHKRRECLVCGAHEWFPLDEIERPAPRSIDLREDPEEPGRPQ